FSLLPGGCLEPTALGTPAGSSAERIMAVHLLFDGKTLTWDTGSAATSATFKASSGVIAAAGRVFRHEDKVYFYLEDYPAPWSEKPKDKGPIPPGPYRLPPPFPKTPYAPFDAAPCGLSAPYSIQQIPRGGAATDDPPATTAGRCEPYWANWG